MKGLRLTEKDRVELDKEIEYILKERIEHRKQCVEFFKKKGADFNIFFPKSKLSQKERMKVVDKHAEWIRKTPNKIWSSKQKEISDKWFKEIIKCQS